MVYEMASWGLVVITIKHQDSKTDVHSVIENRVKEI